jgi:hypothetical protein
MNSFPVPSRIVPSRSPPATVLARGTRSPTATTLLAAIVCFGAATHSAPADDFDEDISDAASALAAIPETSDRSRANELLMKYADARSSVLNELLDQLESREPSNDRSDWNSEVSDGSAALASFASDLPDAAEESFRGFVERETKLWTHFREAPGFPFSRFQLVEIAAKIADERERLDEKWEKLTVADAAFDEALYSTQYEAIAKLRKWGVAIAQVAAPMLEQMGIDGAETAAEILKEAEEKVLEGLKTLRQETAVWKSFVEERENARKFHEAVNFDHIERAMEYAERLETSSNSDDYDAFKDRALRILDEHYDRAEQEYNTFISENKGKFIEALQRDWLLILEDPREVEGWQTIYQLADSELESLLEKHEKGYESLSDGDLKRK